MLNFDNKKYVSRFSKREFSVWNFPVLAFFLMVISGCAITPQPFTSQEIMLEAQQERQRLFLDQEPVSGQVTLYDAMARAVMYNLDHQVKQVEEALEQGNLVMARYDLLPQVVASAGYSNRDNENGSSSKSLSDGSQSLVNSTSQEKSMFTADITHVWNVLDFGVGYTQALQQADEVLIAEEGRRRAVQNIVQDVRYAFWRAASAEMLLPQMDKLLYRVESALDRSRKMEKARAQDPTKILAYQQELLETVKQLWDMRKELSLAKTELASYMNLDPGTSFRIGLNDQQQQYAEQILSVDTMEQMAMTNRPELLTESYNKRISNHEVRKAMLKMLPGLEININANYDDNEFLQNPTWLQAGLRLSWNVFNLLTGPEAIKLAETQQSLADKRYMATAMMVLTQVNLAHQRYYLAVKEYQISNQLDEVHHRKLIHAEAAKRAKTSKELEEIRNQAGALSARMNRGLAFAELQGSLGRIFHSIGTDPLPPVVSSHALNDLALSIEEHEKSLLTSLQADSDTAKEPTVITPVIVEETISEPDVVIEQDEKKETVAEIPEPEKKQQIVSENKTEDFSESMEQEFVVEKKEEPEELIATEADAKQEEQLIEYIEIIANGTKKTAPTESSIDVLEKSYKEPVEEQATVLGDTKKILPESLVEEEVAPELFAQDVPPVEETEIPEEVIVPEFRVQLKSRSRYPIYTSDKTYTDVPSGIAYRTTNGTDVDQVNLFPLK